MTGHNHRMERGAKRQGYLIAGYLLFGFGLVGAVLPIMPTAIFWILAAACFAKSSDRMYRRILSSPHLGPIIEDFLTQGAISPRSKAAAISGMGIGLAIAAFTLGGGLPLMAAITAIGLASAYVLTRPVPREARSAAR